MTGNELVAARDLCLFAHLRLGSLGLYQKKGTVDSLCASPRGLLNSNKASTAHGCWFNPLGRSAIKSGASWGLSIGKQRVVKVGRREQSISY